MKLCVEELIDTERLTDLTSISLLLGIDGGSMVWEAIVARVVLWVLFSYLFTEAKGLFIVEQMS